MFDVCDFVPVFAIMPQSSLIFVYFVQFMYLPPACQGTKDES